jgi:hypothetical protein
MTKKYRSFDWQLFFGEYNMAWKFIGKIMSLTRLLEKWF